MPHALVAGSYPYEVHYHMAAWHSIAEWCLDAPGNSVGHWNGDKCLKLNGDSRDSYIPQYLIVSVFCL
jgi:hypothetical protein